MRLLKIAIIAVLVILFVGAKGESVKNTQSVNSVLGDASFVALFGTNPGPDTDETLRLQTHLKYVEQLLREKPVTHLTPQQKENRNRALDLLRAYWEAAVFPTNYDYPDKRVPCFIDQEDKICAVGYLVEKTAGRQLAEEINAKYKYELITDIEEEVLDHWMQVNGLTVEECAMIQPAYSPPPPVTTPNYRVSKRYALSSAILGGLNFSLGTINAIQIGKGRSNNFVAIAGLVGGASQIVTGAINYAEDPPNVGNTTLDVTKRNLSLLNIGLGTSTMIMSGWNLLRNREVKEKPVNWDVYSFPAQNERMGFGFSLSINLK